MGLLGQRAKRTTIFYASDIHGSEKCLLKFVNAAKFYKADVLILGGDLTGKMVVPLIRQAGGGYRARFQGRHHLLEDETQRQEFERLVRFNGFYPVVLDLDEYQECADDGVKRERLFTELMSQSVRRWVDIVDERLASTGVRCIVYPGNDDEFSVDGIIGESRVMENPDESVVDLGDHELIGMAHTNLTPFGSPRELSEADLEDRLEKLISTLRNPSTSVFALHCPPANSGLDMAPRLSSVDGELKVVTAAGHTEMIPVGSTAVRRVIERYQPLLGAHGHIHESRGTARLGRTVCFNPGSEYSEGLLRGALVVLGADSVVGCQLVTA